MTLDPNARTVRHFVTVAPSPATSGTDWAIDAVLTYWLNAFEQTVPFKVTVFPNSEPPTKQNSEVILVNAYSASTRAGSMVVAEVCPGTAAQGSVRAVRSQGGDASLPQSEIQVISLTGNGGTFTLTFGGNTTSALAWNASAATVQAALQGLASIGASNATVAGSAGGPWTVTFAGSLANSAQSLITADATSLTYTGAGTATPSELTHGGGGSNEVQQIVVVAQSGTFTISFGGQTTVALAWNVSPTTMQAELQALASIGSGNMAVALTAAGTFQLTFQGALANTAESVVTTDATRLALAGINEVQTLAVDGDAGTFRLSADAGANYTAAQSVGVSAATLQTALTGLAAIGANNCVVTYDSKANVYTVTWVGANAGTAQALLTADVASLTVATSHITSSVRAQDGSSARSIQVGDLVEVVQSAQGSVDANATLLTAGKLIMAPFAHEIESGGTLRLDNASVADPVSAPSVAVSLTGGSLTIPAFPTFGHWLIGYTWVDGSGHETKLSPTKLVTITDDNGSSTGSFVITLPPIPANATGFHIYAVNASSGATKRQAAATYISSETVSPTTMTQYNVNGAVPPGSNNFPGIPAKIIAADGTTMILAGDQSHFASSTPAADSGSGGPGIATTFARSDHYHPLPSGIPILYRKNTSKLVNTTADTDLLNGEITVAANVMGANGFLEGVAFGDDVQNSGGTVACFRFKLKFQGTTILDSGAQAGACLNSAVRFAWKAQWTIMNLGATNSQYVTLWIDFGVAAGGTFTNAAPTTGTGRIAAVTSNTGSNNHLRYMMSNTAAIDTTGACAMVLSVVTPSGATTDCTLQGAFVRVA